MKNHIKVSIFLSLHIYAFFILELKETILGAENFILVYMLFNLFFVAGLCIYGFFQQKLLKVFANKKGLFVFCLFYAVLGVLAFISSDKVIYLIAIGLATVMTGILGGIAYFSVYAVVPRWLRGRVIAAGICGGTLIQYIVNVVCIVCNENFAAYIYILVFCAAVLGSFLLLLDKAILQTEEKGINITTDIEQSNHFKLLVLLVAAVAIICYLSSLYEGVMALTYPGEEQNLFVEILLNNTRLLYGTSIIIAGVVADLKGRQYLPLLTVIAMTVLVINIFLLNFPAVRIINWVILFIGAGFLAMFVTLSFIDIAYLTKRPALWASAGRIIKHSITAFGSLLGAYFWAKDSTGLFIILIQYIIFLIVLIFLLFKLYEILTQKTVQRGFYSDTNEIYSQLDAEDIQIMEYHFTQREKQVLSFVLTGTQIKEIAKELYISERTVKFHLSNILSKSGVKNQKELTALLMNGNKSKLGKTVF